MNEIQKEKINRFLNDTIMYDSVKDVMIKEFLRPRRIADVNFLAASRIAIDLLDESFKELEKFRKVEDRRGEKLTNPGL